MRTATAILFGLAGLCNVAFAQDAACTAGAQATYIALAGNADAEEYCDKKIFSMDDSLSATITAAPTPDSLRFRKRKGKETITIDDGEHHGGDDDNGLRSLLKSLSQGPSSVASTFCSCNFPSPTSSEIRPTFYPSACGFPNGTTNATITSNSTITTVTTTVTLTTSDNDFTLTPVATLATSTEDNGRTRSSDDSSTTTV